MSKKRNDLVVVGASQPPALPPSPLPIRWKDFKRFMETGDTLVEYYDQLRTGLCDPDDNRNTIGELEDQAEWCQQLVAKYRAGFERFDPDDNYEPSDDDDADEYDDRELKRSHIAMRISVVIASFPSANPGSPEGYQRMLVEHISATDGLTAPALESACREIVERPKQNWAPSVAEMMAVVKDHVEQWYRRFRAMHEVERMRLSLIKKLTERKEKQAKERHDEQVSCARHDVKRAMEWTRASAKRIEEKKHEIETKKIELAKLIEEHTKIEQLESERMRALRKLTGSAEEQEPGAATKVDGDSRDLPFRTVH